MYEIIKIKKKLFSKATVFITEKKKKKVCIYMYGYKKVKIIIQFL